MAADQFAERLLAIFDAWDARLVEDLATGPLLGFDRVMFLRGQIKALREATDQVRELISPMIDDDPFEGMRDDLGTPEQFHESKAGLR